MRELAKGQEARLCVAVQTVSGTPSASKALEGFCRDLCQQARNKNIDVVSATKAYCHCCCWLP